VVLYLLPGLQFINRPTKRETMRILQSFGLIFDKQTVLISALSALSTLLCRKLVFYIVEREPVS